MMTLHSPQVLASMILERQGPVEPVNAMMKVLFPKTVFAEIMATPDRVSASSILYTISAGGLMLCRSCCGHTSLGVVLE